MKTAITQKGYILPSKDIMIQSLRTLHFDQLRMVQQDELTRIQNDHHRKGYICPAESQYLESLYIDVVLNGKHYNSTQSIIKRTKINQEPIRHIGMQIALRHGYQS